MKGHKRRRPDRGPDVWELIVEAGRDPVTGRRRQTSTTFRGTESAADTALARCVATATETRHGPGTEAPLSHLIDRWIELVADDLSPTTLRGYRGVIRVQINPALGARPIGQITTSELDAFYRRLLETRAPATVRQTHAILRRAFRQAVRWGWLTSNPAVDATPPRVRKPTLVLPTPKQVTSILAAAEAQDAELGAFLRTVAATGARRGEVVGLRESRLDLEAGTVLIERTVVEVGKELVEKDPKTHQARRVAIDPTTVAALRRHLLAAKKRALAGGIARCVDPYVFSATVDGALPVRPSVMTAAFKRLAKERAPGVRLHDLRHFSATQLLAAGVPVKTVSARLGHGSAAMTLDVYAHHLAPADQGAADVLGGLLDG